jgi:rhodanese-related sulfurtransferase/DNA-binding transcriptional ArsR family regulator
VGSRAFKTALYEQLARVGKALASPLRIEILELLTQAPRTVESLAGELALTMANTSAHLQVLKQARLVESKKAGLHVTYRLADDSVAGLVRELRTVAERRLAELERVVRTYLGDRDAMDAVALEELARRLRDDSVIVLDVRPASEYEAGHIEGAVSIPLGELAERMKELPRGKEVVAYCRGPYCVFADEAVATLRQNRRKARRLAEGLPEWRAAGLPVTQKEEG